MSSILSASKDLLARSVEETTWVHLDKNECPEDIPQEIKELVVMKLFTEPWNRYPQPTHLEIEKLICQHLGIGEEHIVSVSGSVTLITTLISHYYLQGRDIIFAHPSFAFYEYHCLTNQIPFSKWLLNDNLDYDPDLLPVIKKESMVIFASPNNPTGNILPIPVLESLLEKNPETIFIADEVYFEYAGFSFEQLIYKYDNLLLIRSFSKTFSAAGVRLGYLLGNKAMASTIRKLILPFSINHFAIQFAKVILQNDQLIDLFQEKLLRLVWEREAQYDILTRPEFQKFFSVKESHTNFLLIRFFSEIEFHKVINHLEKSKIKVYNASMIPMLENCMRVSIGAHEENTRFNRALSQALDIKSI